MPKPGFAIARVLRAYSAKKARLTPCESAPFIFPLYLNQTKWTRRANSLQADGLLVNPARLPLASSGRVPAALPLCSSTTVAILFPRKTRHHSDVERLPQSARQPSSPSYDPNCFYLLPVFVEPRLSNDCASTRRYEVSSKRSREILSFS